MLSIYARVLSFDERVSDREVGTHPTSPPLAQSTQLAETHPCVTPTGAAGHPPPTKCQNSCIP